ncbi:MAG TPA: CPXCG motif-containing cysteine-rich protein [Bacteroidota bacterium]|nr:CPXCG motif-containing cysteine-rich protein [Bacteroidota bacterium]
MEIETTFLCLYCHEVNVTLVDASGGLHQEYIEDCQVCCRPNLLHVTIDGTLEAAKIRTEIP